MHVRCIDLFHIHEYAYPLSDMYDYITQPHESTHSRNCMKYIGI